VDKVGLLLTGTIDISQGDSSNRARGISWNGETSDSNGSIGSESGRSSQRNVDPISPRIGVASGCGRSKLAGNGA